MNSRRAQIAAAALIGLAALEAPGVSADAPPIDSFRARREHREARDRAELVRPPSPGFKAAQGKKAALRLRVRDAVLKPGETVWYRLELTNAGARPLELRGELGDFFKEGYLGGSGAMNFFVTEPGGRRLEMEAPASLACGTPNVDDFDIRFPKSFSEARKAELLELYADPYRHNLDVTLHPGETLVTRAGPPGQFRERIERGEDPETPPPGEHRPLTTAYRFAKPGRYRIQAIITDLPPKGASSPKVRQLHEELALGIIESTTVDIEISH